MLCGIMRRGDKVWKVQSCKTFIYIGALVQLVRIPACHAGGRGFESLTHRYLLVTQEEKQKSVSLRSVKDNAVM